ncbi:MAG: hypothetical protein GY835_23850 [bacterium]|nr:hypothetical protein [bacterium]
MERDKMIKATNVRQGTTGAGGWDVDVSVRDLDGEVTLLPAQSDGQPSRWGDADMWVSGDLLRQLRQREDCHDLLDEMEAVAVRAIEDSSIEPAEGE